MKNIKELSKEVLKGIHAIVFDSDGVTIETGRHDKGLSGLMIKGLNELSKRYEIVVSSGRSLKHLKEMYKDVNVSCFVAENGIVKEEVNKKGYKDYDIYVYDFKQLLVRNAIKKEIEKLDHDAIVGFEDKAVLITVHCNHRVKEIEDIVSRYDDFDFLFNGEAYDIAVKGYDKSLSFDSGKGVIAVGNGLNDKSMLDKAEIGITTDKVVVESDYYTNGLLHSGGLEVINHILRIGESK